MVVDVVNVAGGAEGQISNPKAMLHQVFYNFYKIAKLYQL
jgi:hypothetical protein